MNLIKIGSIVRMSQQCKDKLLGKCYYDDEGRVVHTGTDPIFLNCYNCSSEHLQEFENCLGFVESKYDEDLFNIRWQPKNLRYAYCVNDLEVINFPQNKYYFIYLVKCKDNSIYTGITNNLPKRIEDHNAGKGAKYTKSRGPVKLIKFHICKSKSEALKLEYKIKQLKRSQKLKF